MSGKPFVPVIGNDGGPLMPCTGKRARLLLKSGRARVFRRMPFSIQLKDRSQDDCILQPIQVKIDTGSKGTGLAIVRVKPDGGLVVLSLIEIQHRGELIKRKLRQRRLYRRARRYRKTRYRAARFLNRTKPQGWLPPSLMHRVHTTLTWVKRLMASHPVTSIAVERVKFDTQKLQNPEISGVAYQQGTLFGYEVREYLLEKFNRQCIYCGVSHVTHFEVDHVVPRSRGGSDRVSNLVLSCHPCNQAKGARSLEEFVPNTSQRERIKRQLKRPLGDAAAVNATRNTLLAVMRETGLPIEMGTGGQTKYNRCRLKIPKTHALDAVCVGAVKSVDYWERPTLIAKAVGHGTYQRTLTDKYGFPRLHRSRSKTAFGFATGDIVRALTRQGIFVGRVIVRQRGGFTIDQGDAAPYASYRQCRLIQKNDGYQYGHRPAASYETLASHFHLSRQPIRRKARPGRCPTPS